MISAGRLRELVTFQQKTSIKNSIGEELPTWTDVCTVWAEAIPLRGSALFVANQQVHTVDVRFWIRNQSGVADTMRVIWAGRNYDITSVIPGTGRYAGFTEVMAVNGVRDGR